MIAEGLLQPYRNGDEAHAGDPGVGAAAHASAVGARSRAHARPRAQLLRQRRGPDQRARLSASAGDAAARTARSTSRRSTTDGIGEWDKVAIAYGYQDFPDGTNEAQALQRILDQAWARDLRYMTNQDMGAHPRVNQWSNGTDAAAELTRMMARAARGAVAVRRERDQARHADGADRGGAGAAVSAPPLPGRRDRATWSAACTTSIPCAAMAAIRCAGVGGRAASRAQRADGDDFALGAGAAAGAAEEDSAAPVGIRTHARALPALHGPHVRRRVTPAVVAADHVVGDAAGRERAARVVEQHAIDPTLPGLEDVIDALFAASFGATATHALRGGSEARGRARGGR